MTAVSAAIHCFGCRYSFEGAIEIGWIALNDEDRPDNLSIFSTMLMRNCS